ncbi:ATP-binding protein [Adlercreutzia sp. ZJ138]|uniref:ATP-binding protein n=1 Tax=Adlercreutzia sp. ZJ138 TaxID=2709405 RepID=UPI0013EB545C|nr:ATP-binding protein [Adlercreutzia sp. ZJ138]
MSDSASLEQFIDAVCTTSHLRIEDDLGDGFVRLRSEEAERRQAVHDIRSSEDIVIEMLRNARDADATEIYLATSREGTRRRICVIDNGCGIPPHLHDAVFEPRVTSKLDTMHIDTWGVHGRGMALFSIRENAEIASVLASDKGLGTALLVETDVQRVGEKADQSTFPSFHREASSVKVLGPRNIVRTACEFALDSHHQCLVFAGSSTEIASCLYQRGLHAMSAERRIFHADSSSLPLCERLAASASPEHFAANAQAIGLDLSVRSARRILNGEIAAPADLASIVAAELTRQNKQDTHTSHKESNSKAPNHTSDHVLKGLKLHDNDRHMLEEAVRVAYDDIAARYYLEPDVDPQVTVGKDGIRVFIPFRPVD